MSSGESENDDNLPPPEGFDSDEDIDESGSGSENESGEDDDDDENIDDSSQGAEPAKVCLLESCFVYFTKDIYFFPSHFLQPSRAKFGATTAHKGTQILSSSIVLEFEFFFFVE